MTYESHRQHPRYAVELDAQIDAGGVTVQGRTRDISRGGFCVLTPKALQAGSACRVKLALVFAENQFSEQLSLPAEVAWSTKFKNSYQIGVKFRATDPQSLRYLGLFMKYLDEGVEDDPPGKKRP